MHGMLPPAQRERGQEITTHTFFLYVHRLYLRDSALPQAHGTPRTGPFWWLPRTSRTESHKLALTGKSPNTPSVVNKVKGENRRRKLTTYLSVSLVPIITNTAQTDDQGFNKSRRQNWSGVRSWELELRWKETKLSWRISVLGDRMGDSYNALAQG